ncbi:hypothetical protein CCR87_16400 [Rhodobaculum claviforme]|uniref:Phosphatidylglycerophosphate synthase n=2 Tax=Rhodobaculum claviforme TaxID=1549854 RepID=A0A934TNN8_9RHOB|nr:hypothetical protein [Rhodobaculum claviforme]
MHALPPAADARPSLPARLRPALRSGGGVVVAVGIGAGGLALWAGLPPAVPLLALAAVVVLVGAVLGGLWQAGPAERFAPCSRVTLGRAGLGAILVGLFAAPAALAQPPLAWVAVAIAATALALDGVDGWLARRRNEATAFGARFDMEVDAALGLVLAGLAVASGKVALWVLALGLMRYGFVALAWVWPWLLAPLPESLRRKTVCVIQVGVLAALLAPAIPPMLATWMAGVALAALAGSFAVDIGWLWRQAPRGRAA